MNQQVHNKLVSFIWSIADDCLRDVYVRGKYRDVILPMVVLRRLDALLETTKDAVLEEVRFQKEEMEFVEFEGGGLQDASGYVFYNTSKWTLQRLHDTATNSQQLLQANFEEYLAGFSSNVKEIIDKFNLKRQISHMANKDVLLDVLEKFTSPYINLTPNEKPDPEGRKLPALTNLGMGYVFEELIRKFNEENNEEAGEHFTPREVIELMTHLVFEPVKENLPPVMTIYDPACGSGGMLTESQNFIKDEEGAIKALGDVYLYGKEINDETYAICKSDMMIKGNNPENIRVGSTLSVDEFAGTTFDYMLSNPPYGKSWSSETKYIKDGKEIIDPRFKVVLNDYWGNEEEADATPRSSDGQLLFLMEMVNKMKPLHKSPAGSRIASVHNGSSLFTGDAGGGESNIRRYIIENDLLECIVQMPNNLFYNTGITTYIWLLSNNKTANRKGKVQLIDAGQLYRKLRKNLGNKNCEFAPEHITEIVDVYMRMTAQTAEASNAEQAEAQVFDNADFGYYKVSIERPQRLKTQMTLDKIETLRFEKYLEEPMQYAYTTYGDRVYTDLASLEKNIIAWCEENELDLTSKNKKKLLSPATWTKNHELVQLAQKLYDSLGEQEYMDFNAFTKEADKIFKDLKLKPSATQKKAIYGAVSAYDAQAEKVIKKKEKLTGDKLKDLLSHLGCTAEELVDFGYFPTAKTGEYLTYETETNLRDTENVPLKEPIYAYFLREVKPHVPEAWINLDATKIGYEISFNKYFYKHTPLRSIEEVTHDILELEKQSDGLIAEILNLA
ncbi:class I SAM-dependent DNA methyltransferase [Leeuwenhoekiella sp. MAR_2009_132]|uniref:type I restriction-modification system subunit M n=1 Tax=Leeuwenhoekiella sp. MAR_2009_132 TaxID=1392489 RepID=UPI00048DB48D|nr:class I SAM-dependent DNA methyltransferase [Leeuwenhoekiella sp. MAR_2009_132]